MNYHALTLYNVANWHDSLDCTRTALCAVTGLEPAVVERALADAAAAKGESITSANSTSPRHWGPALNALGYTWETQRERQSDSQVTIDQFMAMTRDPEDVLLVLAFDDANKEGHVFATQGDKLVDAYTQGKVEAFGATPKDYQRFSVTYVLKLFREGSAQ